MRTAGGGEGPPGGTGRGPRGLVGYLESGRQCRLALHNTGREGEAGGGGGGRAERETLLLVIICLSLGGSSCHGTGWAGRALQADSEP